MGPAVLFETLSQCKLPLGTCFGELCWLLLLL
mgnify:CR=1 FL=1